MKKLLFILVLMLSIKAYAQPNKNYVSYRNETAIWSDSKGKWIFGEIKYANIPIEFDKQVVRMQNKSQSIYRSISDLGEKTTYTDDYPSAKIISHSWLAYDEEGKKCKIVMSMTNSDKYDDLIFTVQYDDILFRYYCKRKNLDSLLED